VVAVSLVIEEFDRGGGGRNEERERVISF
jgi:hypothetical protein